MIQKNGLIYLYTINMFSGPTLTQAKSLGGIT